MRKVYLEDLPRCKKGIDWSNCIGCEIKFIYEDIEEKVRIVEYDKPYLYIKYLDKEPFKISTSHFKQCKLGKLLEKTTNKFKVEMEKVFKDNKRDLIIIDRKITTINRKEGYKENQKWYKYKCNKCGYEGWIIEGSLLTNNQGCSCCKGLTVVEGINDIPTTAPWMVKYFQGGYDEAKLYTKSSGQRIIPICPDCGRIKDKPMDIDNIYTRHSINCTCGDGISKPQKFIFNLLEQLNINFETEKVFNWCVFPRYNNIKELQQGRYDYYYKFNHKEFILEVDGEQHHKEKGKNSKFTSLKEQKYIDNMKDKLALENGYEVIRINCKESNLKFIKQSILNSKLNELFNLSIIDWLKCEEFALSNRVKEACDLWNSGIESTKEISKIMKLDSSTINHYLKQGNELGYCNYKTTSIKKKENIIKVSELWNSKLYEIQEIASMINVHSSSIISYLQEGYKMGICDYTAELSKVINFNNIKKRNKERSKSVICLESNQIFISTIELEKQSEELFGVKLDNKGIASNCRGKYKTYKGFTFKYVEDLTDGEKIKYNINNIADENNISISV